MYGIFTDMTGQFLGLILLVNIYPPPWSTMGMRVYNFLMFYLSHILSYILSILQHELSILKFSQLSKFFGILFSELPSPWAQEMTGQSYLDPGVFMGSIGKQTETTQNTGNLT